MVGNTCVSVFRPLNACCAAVYVKYPGYSCNANVGNP